MDPKHLFSLFLVLFVALIGCGDPVDTDDDEEPVAADGHAFTYTAPAQAPSIQTLSVRGAFNEWGQTAMVRGSDGSWRAVVDLSDGTYQYKYFINGTWIDDMCYDETWGHPDHGFVVDTASAGCMADGYGGQNAVLTLGEVPLGFQHVPGDPAQLSVAGGRLSVRFRARGGQVGGARIIAGADTAVAHLQLARGIQEVWRGSLPEGTGRYTVEVETAEGWSSFGPYDAPAELFRSVAWVERAVGYQIFPERFWNGDPTNDHHGPDTDEYHFRHPATGGTEPDLTEEWDGPVLESHCCHQYFGGDLQGIIDRLDHLEGLGVTAVYLNPIFHSGSVHGYDTFDYFQVAPQYGDTTVLRSLVEAAGARGIRLIWDFVPNHVGIGHWAFQDAITNGTSSDYWNWFTFHVPPDSIQAGNGNHYDAWWGFGSLPELRTTDADVFEHLLDVTRHWTEFGLDGIRVDVPGDIGNRGVFFPAWRAAAKAVNPDVYLVGEIWERDAGWLQGNEFDALMNYALGERVVEAFARGDMGGVVAAREMAALYDEYPEAATAMMFNLIASHDTGRLLTKLGGGPLHATPSAAALARQRLASAFLYALPGMPVTYQGDECAQLGSAEGRHTARYPVQWTSCDPAMTGHYADLASLKHDIAALGSPVVRAYLSLPSILAFLRGEPGTGELIAAFNNGSATQSVPLPDGSWTDAVTGTVETGSVALEAFGWRYLVKN
jgi:cyclomaltodextrinase / maltogenic alpha-amylase / neopullulanase